MCSLIKFWREIQKFFETAQKLNLLIKPIVCSEFGTIRKTIFGLAKIWTNPKYFGKYRRIRHLKDSSLQDLNKMILASPAWRRDNLHK
jgi:hypothetical protein